MTAVGVGIGTLEDVLALLPVIVHAFDRDGVCTLTVGGGLDKVGALPGVGVGTSLLDRYADMPDAVRTLRNVLDGVPGAVAATIAGGHLGESLPAGA